MSCPVLLFNATSHKSDISFHLINPATSNRIRMVPTDPDAGPVDRADLVRGYEFEKNRYVPITNEELQSVRLETTDNLEIERFVDAATIDRLFWHDPYFLVPDGDSAVEAYSVIREALARTNRIALGRVVMHTRERLMAVEPRDNGMTAYSLRMRDEVIDPQSAFASFRSVKPDPKMTDIAERIIEQNEGRFEPKEFHDRYEKALRDLVHRKQAGKKTTIEAQPPETSNVIDLMDALRRSLKGATPDRGTKTGPKRRTRR